MNLFDGVTLEISQIAPLLLVLLLLFVFAKTLVLPEGYFKDRMIREAMMKRRAEKEDLERMAELKSQQISEEYDDAEDEE